MKRKISVLMSMLFVFCVSQSFAQYTTLHFEAGTGGSSFTWVMDQNGTNPPLTFPTNPVSGTGNTSSKVAKFDALLAGQPWALTYTDNIDAFQFTNASGSDNTIIKIWVYKPTISNVAIKFEGSSPAIELQVANTVVNQWEELTFNFSGSVGNTYNRLVIIPDFDFARAQNNTIYFDNVRIPTGNIAAPGAPTTAAPTPTKNVVTNNVISIFSNAYTDVAGTDFDPNWGQITNATIDIIASNPTLKYMNLNYQGTQFGSNQDVSGHEFVHVDFWTDNSTLLRFFVISPGFENAYILPITSGQWVSLDIPLASFPSVDLANVFQFKVDGNGTVWFDNLYFWSTPGYTPPATNPTAGAPTPIHDAVANGVISIFSNAYTNVAGTNLNPNWGQATAVSFDTLSGNPSLKYAGLNYQGTQFGSNQDVSGLDYLHVDFWTANSTDLGIYLISPGNEVEYVLPITTGQWVSLDIPLSYFSSTVNLADVFQFKIEGNGTIWFDNLYFWADASSTGTDCPVAYVDLKYVTLNGTTLTKTSGGNGWNSAANSVEVLASGTDGWASMEILETNTWRAFGLAIPNTVVHKNSITYGFLLRDNGKIIIAEGTSSKGIFGDYNTGDTLKIERIGTTINYLKNGVVIYTSATPSTTDLIVDLAIQTVGGTIHNATSDFTCINCSAFALSTSTLRHESCTGANDGSITIASSSEGATFEWADNPSETSNTRTGLAPGTYTVIGTVGLCTYTLNVVVNAGTACENMGCPVTWTNITKSAVIGNTLKRTSTGTLWDAGANTNEVLASGANGWASMQVAETNTFRTFGLSAPNTSASDTINYAFVLRSNGVVLVTENAVQVANLGTYATGDIFKVERVGTVVFYYQNGVVEYVSSVPSTTSLVVDASIKANNATIYNVRTNFSCVAPCPIVWTSIKKTTVSGTTITKTGTGTQWNGSANSSTTLLSGQNGYASMEVLETNTFRVFGLAIPNTASNNTTITYGFQLRDNGILQIVQNGALIGSYGAYSTGDVFRVERFDTLIEYYRNNVLLYTSAMGSTTNLIADISIKTIGGTIHNVQTTFSCGSARPTSNVATTTDISNNTNVVNTFNDVMAYPNPFTEELILNYTEGVEDVKSIELYNINGQHIRSIEISQDGQTIINTSDLTSGLYIISINGVKHLKVVKM